MDSPARYTSRLAQYGQVSPSRMARLICLTPGGTGSGIAPIVAGGPIPQHPYWPVGLHSVRVLVIGSGAREHALVNGLLRDPSVTEVVCAPGNAGIAAVVKTVPVDASSGSAVVSLAQNFAQSLVQEDHARRPSFALSHA